MGIPIEPRLSSAALLKRAALLPPPPPPDSPLLDASALSALRDYYAADPPHPRRGRLLLQRLVRAPAARGPPPRSHPEYLHAFDRLLTRLLRPHPADRPADHLLLAELRSLTRAAPDLSHLTHIPRRREESRAAAPPPPPAATPPSVAAVEAPPVGVCLRFVDDSEDEGSPSFRLARMPDVDAVEGPDMLQMILDALTSLTACECRVDAILVKDGLMSAASIAEGVTLLKLLSSEMDPAFDEERNVVLHPVTMDEVQLWAY